MYARAANALDISHWLNSLFIYAVFYVTPSTLPVALWRVVGKVEETTEMLPAFDDRGGIPPLV